MRRILIATATAIAAAAAAAAVPAAAAPAAGAFDPLTASYHAASDTFCIRSGWRYVQSDFGRPARKGECRTASQWRARGVVFDEAPVAHLRARRAARTIVASL